MRNRATNEPRWLDEAATIGAQLCASAVRHHGRCTWLGRSASELTQFGGIVQPTVSGLGPELYDGTAGVALFLAQLHVHTGDRETMTIALEAIAHALDESKRATSRIGLYQGWTGIAFAAARTAVLLDVPALSERARSLLAPLEDGASVDTASCDLISGLAGAITALVSWPPELRNDADLEICDRLGIALAAAAIPYEGSWAWPTDKATGSASATSQPLTGLSHGAAGMGVVLLDLAKRTKNARFDEVGRGAFAYEARLFDERRRNWPDFRVNDWNPAGRALDSFGWCHGEPGIALARLHGISLEKNPEWRKDWVVALESSRLVARERSESGADATLCHGLAGLAEPLIEASRLGTRDEQRKTRDELARLWTPLCRTLGATKHWPSGLPSRGPNPSLMLGTAGIGYTFLRMHDPKTPSVLLPLLGSER